MRFEELGTITVVYAGESNRTTRVLEVCQVVVLAMDFCDQPIVIFLNSSCLCSDALCKGMHGICSHAFLLLYFWVRGHRTKLGS